MLDTNIWSIYAGENAEYAIGGPTIELFCASYKDTHPDKYVTYRLEEYGYTPIWSNESDGYGIWDLEPDELNGIYTKSDTSKHEAMWIASPGHAGNARFLIASFDNGYIGYADYIGLGPGFCPIVCLKSNVKLEQLSVDIFRIL